MDKKSSLGSDVLPEIDPVCEKAEAGGSVGELTENPEEGVIISHPSGETDGLSDSHPENPVPQQAPLPIENPVVYEKVLKNISEIQSLTEKPLKTGFTNISVLIKMLEKTAETLRKISGYRNADELAEKCRQQAGQLQEETYSRAKTAMDGTKGTAGYEYAMKLFQQIPGYRDADELALDCERKSQEFIKREKRKGPEFSVIALSLLLIIFISALLVISFSEGKRPDLIPVTEPAAEQTGTPTSVPAQTPEQLNGSGSLENEGKLFPSVPLVFDQESLEILYYRGLTYIYGIGVEKSFEIGGEYLKMAADQGLAEAQFDLGLMYYKGEGVEKSYDEAVKYWKLSADQGYEKALNNLGFMYEKGFGVPMDWEIAMEYYRQSAEKGNQNGKESLENLQQKIELTAAPAATVWPDPEP
ncbi:MAG: sel1 repeat family protein [Anaerolineaceae bacterium]|nr:sel1 repeat family protein [Anaerolineaceae bacterium]